MGDYSVIARRISDKYVQYGFGGGSGYFNNVGVRILYWYSERKSKDFPKYDDLIEYLFSLGATELIGKPGSEKGGEKFIWSHHDSDDKWHYVIPGPFRIKIPLELIANNLDEKYRKLYYFFDDWVVVKANSNFEKVERFIVKEDTGNHVETIFWD